MAQIQAPSPGSERPPLTPQSRLGWILEGTFKFVEILGTTENSTIYLAENINTSVNYAIKALRKYESDGSPISFRRRSRQRHEILFHFQACAGTPPPPNIVSLHQTIKHPDCTYLVLEYYPRGDLFSHIAVAPGARQFVHNDNTIRTAFLQLLDAVNHCHGLGIYHRDLKPENIFVTGSGVQPFGLVLGDFGYATRLEYSEDYRGVGSRYYRSPGEPFP
jgi:serine/threonine protein kinase